MLGDEVVELHVVQDEVVQQGCGAGVLNLFFKITFIAEDFLNIPEEQLALPPLAS